MNLILTAKYRVLFLYRPVFAMESAFAQTPKT